MNRSCGHAKRGALAPTLFVLWSLFCGLSVAAQESRIDWHTDWATACAEAKASGKNVLVAIRIRT